MKTEDISGFPNLTVDPATIDEIVVFTSRKVTIMSNILKSTKLDIALVKPYFRRFALPCSCRLCLPQSIVLC